MEQKKIQRLNELAKKAKGPEGLTGPEEAERAALRREYVDCVLGNLQSQLDHTYVVDEKGRKRKLRETQIKSRRERFPRPKGTGLGRPCGNMQDLASYFASDQGAKSQESFVDFKILQRKAGEKEPPSTEDGFHQGFLRKKEE